MTYSFCQAALGPLHLKGSHLLKQCELSILLSCAYIQIVMRKLTRGTYSLSGKMAYPFPLRRLQFDRSLCQAEGGTPHKNC